MSTLALFAALGGSSYAAVSLPAHSVGERALANGGVTRAKLGFPLGAVTASRSTTLASAYCAPGAACGAGVPSDLAAVKLRLSRAANVVVIGSLQVAGAVTGASTLSVQAKIDGVESTTLRPAVDSIAPQATLTMAYQRQVALSTGDHTIGLTGLASGGAGTVSLRPVTLTAIVLPRLTR